MPETPKPTKAARVLDPDIARLREAHAQNVLDLKRRRTSAKILQTIIEKRLPALIYDDIVKLIAAIGPKPLPPRPVQAPQAPRPAQPLPGAVPVMGGRKP